jgi:hypothetical protein
MESFIALSVEELENRQQSTRASPVAANPTALEELCLIATMNGFSGRELWQKST